MKTLEEKFWSKVKKGKKSECWIWIGAREKLGYGKLVIERATLKTIKAHRLSYLLNVGEIPSGICVCHKCDNPACVNPAHLFLGTHVENMADMKKKGRLGNRMGEKNANSKLIEKDVLEIIKLKKQGLSQQVIADKFGVSQVRISMIMTGKTWKHLKVEI